MQQSRYENHLCVGGGGVFFVSHLVILPLQKRKEETNPKV